MEGMSVEKIKGGKLVRIKVGYEERINHVKIMGDFFLHPEESIEDIEKSMVGLSVDATESDLISKINTAIAAKNIEMIGIDTESIARLVKGAMQ